MNKVERIKYRRERIRSQKGVNKMLNLGVKKIVLLYPPITNGKRNWRYDFITHTKNRYDEEGNIIEQVDSDGYKKI